MRVHGRRRWSFLYLPLLVVARLSFNPQKSVSWPGWQRLHHSTGGARRGRRTAPREALLNSCKVAFAAMLIALVLGTPRRVGDGPLHVLRQERSVVPAGAAHRPAGHRHRYRVAEHVLAHHRPRSVLVQGRLRVPLAGHRPRHVLRGGGLQQRGRPPAPLVAEPAGGSAPTSVRTARRRSGTSRSR